jgi:hypothetical protein
MQKNHLALRLSECPNSGRCSTVLLVADIAAQHKRSMTAAENALFSINKLNVVRSSIPAVTRVDYSAGVQTVHRVARIAWARTTATFFSFRSHSLWWKRSIGFPRHRAADGSRERELRRVAKYAG